MSCCVIMLASPAPGGGVTYHGLWEFGGAIGTFVPATNYEPPRVIPAEAAVVGNTDQVRTKPVLVSLLARLKLEMFALVTRPRYPRDLFGGEIMGPSSFLHWRPIAAVRNDMVKWTAANWVADQGPTGRVNQGVPFNNVGIETSSNAMWLGNAADSDATIVASRQRGPLLGLHGAALILNFDALADDTALTAAAQKVVNAVDTFAIYP